jgi:curved DNA-binding protein CbpA
METDALGYYHILGCSVDADDRTLKISYRDRAKFWHPDHNPAEDALEQFQKISSAYAVLSNSKTRFVYDLLSLAYHKNDFPDMATLKIYKSVKGEETPFLRVFQLSVVRAKLFSSCSETQNLVGTYADAEDFISKTTTQNWLNGCRNPKAAFLAYRALKKNYASVNENRADNFKMLVHNAAAFYAEDKADKAYLSLLQAVDYALPSDREEIRGYLNRLPQIRTTLPVWNYQALKQIQLRIPKMVAGTLVGAVSAGVLLIVLGLNWIKKPEKIYYYQEVNFSNGMQTVDDIAVSKVYNIPVDLSDLKMLYHTTDRVDVMYGPGEKFDRMATLQMRQTVRLTGYTVDQEWFRVMMDNGETGFVKKGFLKAGIGREIPTESKILARPE